MGWSDQMIEPASWVGPLEQGLTMYVTTCPRHHGQAGVKIIEGTFTPSIIVREIDPETDPHFRGPSLADVSSKLPRGGLKADVKGPWIGLQPVPVPSAAMEPVDVVVEVEQVVRG